MSFAHRSVLLEPTVAALIEPDFHIKRAGLIAPKAIPNAVYVDATFGRGGHSQYLLQHVDASARLFVIDKDPQAIEAAQALASQDQRITVIHAGFEQMHTALSEHGVHAVDGIMMDLGVSSPQLDAAERGFSFMREGPLDMRMNNSTGLTAAEWLSQASVEEIKEVIADYGEERFAFQIAKAIVSRRESLPLRTTSDLAELVASVVRTREKGHHPATRTFQAIRIYLNRELEELALTLPLSLELLKPDGRLAVISFHSLEDRIVKQFINTAANPDAAVAHLPLTVEQLPQPWLRSIGRVLPNAAEIEHNVRARSAVLRVAERTYTPLQDDWRATFDQAHQALAGRGDHSRRGKRR
ncbi:MAG TPA: 16S rRNA (cytosine(1402)-N(4))-methyltransferase RsmH [Candidatus Paenalcaligenes intestinipullorum]|uniref:Ribosomal RNA small subunit methyltransferase H n=1 Tax=Candidatus Paenalcaligenes intestinipullorum TaxID=2838718 RepID=A0A9D2RJX3_9BURK|nr:16S rRNA (cytosine(1402)-N(4))-methyltransferase RsmH [Candidatus Paenalcaligenes intestinipullorum]